MPDTKITNLAALTATAADEIPVNRAGSDGKITVGNIPEGWVNIKEYGAVGDDTTDDTTAIQDAINDAFVVCTTNASAPPAGNRVIYIPPGRYKITAPLTMEGTFGARMLGAGRFTSQIIQHTANTSAFVTNGCQYSHFSDFYIEADSNGGGSAISFALDWDGSGAALQSNTFSNMQFGGGDYGVKIAESGFMGSENLFLNCFFGNCVEAGLWTGAFNALQNSVVGGNFQGCGYGIEIFRGSVPIVNSVGFQTSTDYDILVTSSADDILIVSGCRTESTNFVQANRQVIMLLGNTQVASADGFFLLMQNQSALIDGCISVNGRVSIREASYLSVRQSYFGRGGGTDWLQQRNPLAAGAVEVEGVHLGETEATGTLAELIKRRRITGDGDYNYVIAGPATTLTIATGAITATYNYHLVDTEAAAATDDLDTISGGVAGQRLVLRAANSARTVVVKDGTGNIQCAGDFSLDNAQDTIELIYDSALSAWLEIGRSDNGA